MAEKPIDKAKKLFTENKKWACVGGGILAAILIAIVAVVALTTGRHIKSTIVYSSEDKQATMTVELGPAEGGQGSVEQPVTEVDGQEIKTVESVDSDGPVVNLEGDTCEGECGRGSAWGVNISSPQAFKDSTLGRCIDTDGYFGSQCWDLGNAFWVEYVNRWLSTCGKGGAKHTIEDGCWQRNAGSEFTMVWDARDIQAGDWVVFNNGTWGHIGMAMGGYNNGYVTLLGENQGGADCPGGGAATNIINISLAYFAGAFRPNIYIKPEPTPPAPTPTPTPTDEYVYYTVKKGDTLGQILWNMGYSGSKMFGDDGFAQKVADENGIAWRGLIYPGQEIKVKKAEL